MPELPGIPDANYHTVPSPLIFCIVLAAVKCNAMFFGARGGASLKSHLSKKVSKGGCPGAPSLTGSGLKSEAIRRLKRKELVLSCLDCTERYRTSTFDRFLSAIQTELGNRSVRARPCMRARARARSLAHQWLEPGPQIEIQSPRRW